MSFDISRALSNVSTRAPRDLARGGRHHAASTWLAPRPAPRIRPRVRTPGRRRTQPLLRPGRAAPRAALAALGATAARIRADATAGVALRRPLPRERGLGLPDAPAARGRGARALRGGGRKARL